jgi:uncharacterized membrane protein
MSSHTTHPLTDAWLRDLELLLHGIEPGERAEVLAGVREHLDGSLPSDAGDDDVRRVLADLGSPQSVADEAYADRPAGPSAVAGAHPAVPTDAIDDDFTRPSRRWVGITASTLLIIDFAALAAAALLGDAGLVLLVFTYLTGPLWFAASAMVLTSRRLWTSGEKALLVALVPVAYLVTALTSIALLNNGMPPFLIPWLGLFVAVVGGGWLLLRTAHRGLARAG